MTTEQCFGTVFTKQIGEMVDFIFSKFIYVLKILLVKIFKQKKKHVIRSLWVRGL